MSWLSADAAQSLFAISVSAKVFSQLLLAWEEMKIEIYGSHGVAEDSCLQGPNIV
jgi:hypothetical protein